MCGLEFPDIERSIWQRYDREDVVVIGVGTGGLFGQDTQQQLREFVSQTGVTFPVGWDDTDSYDRFPATGAISPFPLDVVIDREGRIAYVSREFDAAALEAAVAGLLD